MLGVKRASVNNAWPRELDSYGLNFSRSSAARGNDNQGGRGMLRARSRRAMFFWKEDTASSADSVRDKHFTLRASSEAQLANGLACRDGPLEPSAKTLL